MSLSTLDDTIVAIASPPGPAPRGIVRVSGANVRLVVGAIFEPDDGERWARTPLPERHTGAVPLDGVALPVAVHLWPTSRSYTGQPMAEIHAIGSPPLLDLVVQRLCDHGARPAGRGEFTLRAFLAGRLDLVRAEAVLGVIDADDHVELERALAQLGGGVSSRMQLVRTDLLELLADLEAGLDFVDEDIEFVPASEVVRRLDEAERYVADLLTRASGRMQSSARPVVVLAGLPNAGKSTLFNRLAPSGGALVSDIAGTTRDWLVTEIELAGRTVELIDTAGWERRDEAISTEAQRLRAEQLARADLVVWCTAANADAAERRLDETLTCDLAHTVLPVLTKSDLLDSFTSTHDDLTFSIHRPPDLDQLRDAIARQLDAPTTDRGELLATTSARCRESLVGAGGALDRARTAADERAGDEFVSLEVRDALDHLGTILGLVYTDDVLDRVFSKFCIGK